MALDLILLVILLAAAFVAGHLLRSLRQGPPSAEREALLREHQAEREALLLQHTAERERLVREHHVERERLRLENEAAIEEARKTSVEASRKTLTGHMTERLAPHMPSFPYDPTEIRFLGSPVDYVVFRGLAAGRVEEIIFLEVKSGRGQLSTRERSVRATLESAKVSWDLYRVQYPAAGATGGSAAQA